MWQSSQIISILDIIRPSSLDAFKEVYCKIIALKTN